MKHGLSLSLPLLGRDMIKNRNLSPLFLTLMSRDQEAEDPRPGARWGSDSGQESEGARVKVVTFGAWIGLPSKNVGPNVPNKQMFQRPGYLFVVITLSIVY